MSERIDTKAVLKTGCDLTALHDAISATGGWTDTVDEAFAAVQHDRNKLLGVLAQEITDRGAALARIEALWERQETLVRLLGLAKANEDLTDPDTWNDEADAAIAAEEKR